jgi:hypothetical protein
MASPELRTDLRSRWRSYLATAGVLLIFAGLVAFGVWTTRSPPPTPTAPSPAGFSSQWRCAPATGAHPVCWRELPPAARRGPPAGP